MQVVVSWLNPLPDCPQTPSAAVFSLDSHYVRELVVGREDGEFAAAAGGGGSVDLGGAGGGGIRIVAAIVGVLGRGAV